MWTRYSTSPQRVHRLLDKWMKKLTIKVEKEMSSKIELSIGWYRNQMLFLCAPVTSWIPFSSSILPRVFSVCLSPQQHVSFLKAEAVSYSSCIPHTHPLPSTELRKCLLDHSPWMTRSTWRWHRVSVQVGGNPKEASASWVKEHRKDHMGN